MSSFGVVIVSRWWCQDCEIVGLKYTGGVAQFHLSNCFDDRVIQEKNKSQEQPHSYSLQHAWNMIIKYRINEEMVDGNRNCGQEGDNKCWTMEQVKMKTGVEDINFTVIVTSAM